MARSSTFTIGVLSGLLIGAAIAVLVAYRRGTFCPVCGGRVVLQNGSLHCASCGVKIRLGEP